MSETLRDRNASMPDCTLSGARTKKAMETAVHVDRGRSTITWKTLRVYAQFGGSTECHSVGPESTLSSANPSK